MMTHCLPLCQSQGPGLTGEKGGGAEGVYSFLYFLFGQLGVTKEPPGSASGTGYSGKRREEWGKVGGELGTSGLFEP